MKKQFLKHAILFPVIICSLIIGCSQTISPSQMQKNSTETSLSGADITESQQIYEHSEPPSPCETQKQSQEQEEPAYEMKHYTQAQNEHSSVSIEYPVFYGMENSKELNEIILETVQNMSTLAPELFPLDTQYTFSYQSRVTFRNSDIVSIVFWGTQDIEVSAFPTSTLKTLNIDLESLKTVALTDLYNIDENFKELFFEKSFYPSVPVSNYEESDFSEMLKLQTDEYRSVSQFSLPDTITFFLTPEGIVLCLFASHDVGDHFEAELSYDDIQSHYIGKYHFEE